MIETIFDDPIALRIFIVVAGVCGLILIIAITGMVTDMIAPLIKARAENSKKLIEDFTRRSK